MPTSLCYFETLYQTLKLLEYKSVIYRSPGTVEIWTVLENSECQLPIPPALVTGETAEKPQGQPSSLFGLILLPSFPICPLRCSHPPLLTPVGVCQASLSTLAVLGSLGFSQAHRSPSPSSLVVGRGVTSARSGYPQEFPLISADRAGGGSWLGGGSNWKISSAPKHILLLKASMQAL